MVLPDIDICPGPFDLDREIVRPETGYRIAIAIDNSHFGQDSPNLVGLAIVIPLRNTRT